MLRYIIVFTAVSACFVASNNFGPQYPATKGEVWPKPKHQITENIYYNIFQNFNISVVGETCEILTKAVERYGFFMRITQRLARRIGKRHVDRQRRSIDPDFKGPIHTLNLRLKAPCEEYPYFGMDESCYITSCYNQYERGVSKRMWNYYNYDTVTINAGETAGTTSVLIKATDNLTVRSTAELESSSIWGILRGLETWTHLMYLPDDEIEVRINKTDIIDAPRYIHRGLLIDTSRHYISLSNILKTLDAMAMNKLNVLHWHIVDDQSFPYQSEKFPTLSRYGAYHSSLVYTKDNIKMIINYARDRGIRVLPEFDVPGHTQSWGAAFPSILTECYKCNGHTSSWGQAYPNILTNCYRHGVPYDLGPMNPIKNVTYKLLQDLLTEVQDWFPDKYLHIGGDEVDLACWESNPELQQFMKARNMTSANKLHALFMENVIPLLGRKSTPIVWQEVFDEGVPLSKDTLIQVWKGGEIYEMTAILSAGYKVLYSSAWYLDHLKTGGDWENCYRNDPRQLVSRFAGYNIDLNNIVGGEACMWGEVVDDFNIISRVWPRASAVAERLWSPETRMFDIPDSVYHRLEEHTCRMNRRGIRAQPPSGPGFCIGADLVTA